MSDLPADAALIAESRRVDATVLLSSQKAGTPALIVPQALDALQASLDRGRPLYAFANARANLAPFGFLFERSWAGDTEVAAVAGRATCAVLTQGAWSDVSLLLANGSFIVRGSGPGTAPGGVSLRLADTQPIRFVSIEPRSIGYALTAAPNEGMQELDRAAARSSRDHATALHIPETGRRDPVTFTFARPPHVAVATADSASPVSICPGLARGGFTLGRSPTAEAALIMTSEAAFGYGWHQAEADPDPFRWTSALYSSIRVSVAPPGPIRLTITASPAVRAPQNPTIGLVVNACTFPARPMTPGQGDYEWDVPTNCWRAGDNQIWANVTPLVTPHSLNGGPDMRLLGARVGAVRLKRIANQNAK